MFCCKEDQDKGSKQEVYIECLLHVKARHGALGTI